MVFTAFMGCEYDDDISGTTSKTIKYKVECEPAGFDITYENSSGGTSQRDVDDTEWTTSFTAQSDDFIYISAQADNENASILAKIYCNGELIEHSKSEGDYVIATASGSVP